MFFKVLHGAGEHSADDLLPKIECPVLVIAGERDTFTPPALAERMAKAIPGGETFIGNQNLMRERNGRGLALQTKQALAHRDDVFLPPARGALENLEASCRDGQDDVIEGASLHSGRTASCEKPAIVL